MVIGNDLRNEPRADIHRNLVPTWGSGDLKTDWKVAAQRAGNYILEVNPRLLIFV